MTLMFLAFAFNVSFKHIVDGKGKEPQSSGGCQSISTLCSLISFCGKGSIFEMILRICGNSSDIHSTDHLMSHFGLKSGFQKFLGF